jgi:hypothetical protein
VLYAEGRVHCKERPKADRLRENCNYFTTSIDGAPLSHTPRWPSQASPTKHISFVSSSPSSPSSASLQNVLPRLDVYWNYFPRLPIPHISVYTAQFQQRIVVCLLDNSTVLHDNNHIAVDNSRQSMGHNDLGAVASQFVEGLGKLHLCHSVYCRSRLILNLDS